MSLFASLFPVVSWVVYGYAVLLYERRRPSLSSLMTLQRRRWVANAVTRETPMDAILSGNLMSSVSFFASTTVLLILALFAVFGQLPAVVRALYDFNPAITGNAVAIHLMALLSMFVLAFLAFTLSLRQFNHFCILLGAIPHDPTRLLDDDISSIAEVNSLAARNFNNGIRAYYFAIGALVWFASPLASVLVTLAIVALLFHREFYSIPRGVIAHLSKD